MCWRGIKVFTAAQRFYISYATIWGQNIRDEEAARLTKVDVHSLGKNRVNATLRNIASFYEAFGITDGAMFLPEEKRVVIWCSYKINFSRVHQLSAKLNGKIIGTAELNAPDYKDPSVLSYILHGWLNVYKAAGFKRVNDWIAMDAAASKPCHDYQKTGPDIWYLSSLSVDPSMQGIGLGSKLVDYYENYIREHGGKQVVLVTNSQKNLNFYLKRGYELFDEREFEYNGNTMGNWSLKKVL